MSLDRQLRHQEGVVSRRQVLECGLDDLHIARMIRRREWARVFDGVYIDHTGPPSWRQQAWAACLVHQPAALAGASALRAAGVQVGLPSSGIELVVARHRRVDDPPGIRTSRVAHFDQLVHLHLSPPRMKIEPAALLVASRSSSEDAAVAALGDLCQQRRTTPARLLMALEEWTRLPRRRLLLSVLDDVATGTYSALERRYLVGVERPHGLPTGLRQRRVRPGRAVHYRDVDYLDLHTIVELDGRLGHEAGADRWADLGRDLLNAVSGDLTLRIGWGQVLEPCRLAALVGELLRHRRWTGKIHLCGIECRMNDEGGSPAPGAADPPRSAG